jgi:Mg/Co/Ni transporter MgtE
MRGEHVMDMKSLKLWAEKAFAQIIIAAIMAFMVVAILIVVMIPVLNGILNATPAILSGPLNTTQTQVASTIGSSLGLLIIVLLLLAVLAIIIVIGLFQYFVGGMGGGRQ